MYRLLALSDSSSFTFLQKTVESNLVLHLIIVNNDYFFVVKEMLEKFGISQVNIDRMCREKCFPVYWVTNLQKQGTEFIDFLTNHNIIKPLLNVENSSLKTVQLFKYPRPTFDDLFQNLKLLKTKPYTRSTRRPINTIAWDSNEKTPFLLPNQVFVDFKKLQKTINLICPQVLKHSLFKSALTRMICKKASINHKIVHLLSVLSFFYLHRLTDLCSTLADDYFLPTMCSYVNEHLFPNHKLLIIISREHGHLVSPITNLEIPVEVHAKRYDNIPESIRCFMGMNDEITTAPSVLYKLEAFHHTYFAKNEMVDVHIFE